MNRGAPPRLVAAAACALSLGCAPADVVLRSNHYRVVVPGAWKVTRRSEEPHKPVVLLVPSPVVTALGGGPVELRLYAWVAPAHAGDPIQEAVGRLAGRDEVEWRLAAAPDERRCGERPRFFSLFGEQHLATHLRAPGNRHLIVTAGEAMGSLVAVVGLVVDDPRFCEKVGATEAAMADLGTLMAPSYDLVRANVDPFVLPNPHSGRPDVILPRPQFP